MTEGPPPRARRLRIRITYSHVVNIIVKLALMCARVCAGWSPQRLGLGALKAPTANCCVPACPHPHPPACTAEPARSAPSCISTHAFSLAIAAACVYRLRHARVPPSCAHPCVCPTTPLARNLPTLPPSHGPTPSSAKTANFKALAPYLHTVGVTLKADDVRAIATETRGAGAKVLLALRTYQDQQRAAARSKATAGSWVCGCVGVWVGCVGVRMVYGV